MKYQVLPFAIKTLDPRGMTQLTFFFILFVHTNILACWEVYFIFIFFGDEFVVQADFNS